ncbi:hypothetical protein PILCRDRAFT_750354 [Piloderma croceum F 1598]|uniref:Uncharacterized protein n=1 Tax=Piloderma croceum (strain F 1598) TaxID=765440 RepID=A0A0C3EUI4_PILCF|nr:hypothetical protein PILCRDRAFT_750354 [Piloderma croceum F 1598]
MSLVLAVYPSTVPIIYSCVRRTLPTSIYDYRLARRCRSMRTLSYYMVPFGNVGSNHIPLRGRWFCLDKNWIQFEFIYHYVYEVAREHIYSSFRRTPVQVAWRSHTRKSKI